MANGKLNKKYFPLIWVALLVAFLVRNAYNMFFFVGDYEITGTADVIILILRFLFSYGIIPMAVTFLCAFVVWQIGASRYVRCISRNDFCYLVMATTAAVKFLVGIIEVFAILQPDVAVITTTIFDFTLLTAAFIALFFFVIVKWYKFNPVEKYNAFKMWFIVYMIVLGLSVLSQNVTIVAMIDGSQFSQYMWLIMHEMGYNLVITTLQVNASVAAICIYFALLVAVIVFGELLRRQSNKFRNPETRGEFYQQYDNRGYSMRGDAGSVFEDVNDSAKKKDDENVFDEFDI